jgi:Tfp pilus assembly protein FimT
MLEILLSLAIIALLAAVLIGGSAPLLNSQPASVDEVFWQAVQAARKSALRSGREARLTFVDDKDKGKEFVVDDGEAKQDFAVPAASGDALQVTFLSTQKGGNSILVGGVLVETQVVSPVVFYSDGTCTPFRMQVFNRGGAHVVAIDSWTCALILTPPDPNAPPSS